MSNNAKARRAALRKLLLSGSPGTQMELCERLAERGFTATQSTVSRDLKLLGAERVIREDGDFAYVLRTGPPGPFPADMVLAVEHNECLVVVRTRVGRAQAVGLDLDAMRLPNMIGTLAGDDTVLVIPRSVHATADLARQLRELTGLAT